MLLPGLGSWFVLGPWSPTPRSHHRSDDLALTPRGAGAAPGAYACPTGALVSPGWSTPAAVWPGWCNRPGPSRRATVVRWVVASTDRRNASRSADQPVATGATRLRRRTRTVSPGSIGRAPRGQRCRADARHGVGTYPIGTPVYLRERTGGPGNVGNGNHLRPGARCSAGLASDDAMIVEHPAGGPGVGRTTWWMRPGDPSTGHQ